MSGADPVAELLYHVDFAVLFAYLALWQTWTWLALLVCLPLGAIVRRAYERRLAVLLGLTLAIVIVALNTAVIALDVADDPDFFRATWPTYFFPLVVMVCWLLHLPIGLLAFSLGLGAVELFGRRLAGTRRLGPGRARHRPRRARPTM
jgi:hypothetical protein